MALIDTHCHLDFTEDKKGWIERAKEAGVGKIINVGTSIEGSRKSVRIAEQRRTDTRIYASIGIHPQDGEGDVKKYGPLGKCVDELRKIAESSKRVVAVGEIGLDYYLEGGQRPVTSDQEKKFQRELFREQIKLAQELDLPILVHCRNAWEEIFEIISKEQNSHPEFISGSNKKTPKQNQIPKQVFDPEGSQTRWVRDDTVSNDRGELRGLFHSWTGDWEAAKKALDLGFYISFSGIVTFKNAPLVQEVAKKVPLDRILVETDSPFLSPEPHRGMQNEPKNVIITARFLAQLRSVSLATIEEVTSENAGRLLVI